MAFFYVQDSPLDPLSTHSVRKEGKLISDFLRRKLQAEPEISSKVLPLYP